MTIYSMGNGANEGDEMVVDQLLSSVGVAHHMDEYYMDIITGLTGCGPSYVSCEIGREGVVGNYPGIYNVHVLGNMCIIVLKFHNY